MGHLDVVVNNAGITKDNLLLRMREEEFDDVIRINLKGTYNCIRHVARIMMKQRHGKIVNMARCCRFMRQYRSGQLCG